MISASLSATAGSASGINDMMISGRWIPGTSGSESESPSYAEGNSPATHLADPTGRAEHQNSTIRLAPCFSAQGEERRRGAGTGRVLVHCTTHRETTGTESVRPTPVPLACAVTALAIKPRAGSEATRSCEWSAAHRSPAPNASAAPDGGARVVVAAQRDT